MGSRARRRREPPDPPAETRAGGTRSASPYGLRSARRRRNPQSEKINHTHQPTRVEPLQTSTPGPLRTSTPIRSSPYPTPQDLREYEDIHPGFTDRILKLTEQETEHRIREESLRNRATIEIAKRGQALAFIVVMTLVGGGIAGILTGHSVGGLAGLIVAAATLVGAFVAPNLFARRSRRREGGNPAIEESTQSQSEPGPPARAEGP